MEPTFTSFFQNATGSDKIPYPYQEHLADGPWPDIIDIPTGMGKTAGIIISWLYKRIKNDPSTPRRLVYCLPMRVLVEQTADNARLWIENLMKTGQIPESARPEVHLMMGGAIDLDWDTYPENSAILVGTQDQLLSRAMNRGYSMSRFRWPMHFGLLNNDCLWVMDEVQLMGVGLATTTQLQGFRNTMGTALPVKSIWMSATLQKDWLHTVDFNPEAEIKEECALSQEDLNTLSIKKRYEAKKPLKQADFSAGDIKKIARLILDTHKSGTRTLAVVNTVKRARDIYDALSKEKSKATLVLVHSRFRPTDRREALNRLLAQPEKEGTICIATQVVEAGVDISARALITDLAPWPSLVQRFGRCNRTGDDAKAEVIWLDLNLANKNEVIPYEAEELEQARSTLLGISDVGPHNLPPVTGTANYRHVLRRKDMVDLFDTTPDLAGADTDVSRFIRETEDHDVSVFWRELPDGRLGVDESSPIRDELCSVSISDLNKIVDLDKWYFDQLEKRWIRPTTITPGMIILLRVEDGCYSTEKGWTGQKRDVPDMIEHEKIPAKGYGDDYDSSGTWQTLADHSDAVVREVEDLLRQVPQVDDKGRQALLDAARWHDVGKAHKICQNAFLGDPPQADPHIVWAKTALKGIRYERTGFRHELASALVMLQQKQSDLIAYLVAAHHGKVRLSIRSLPIERSPDNPGKRFARGIWDGDTLNAVELGNGHVSPEITFDLSFMEFGDGPHGPSWLARMLALRDDPLIGPFRLAFLESLLRAADWRASKKAGENHA